MDCEALFNILENAVKVHAVRGSIRVSAVRWEAYTKITITDTGRGIPERARKGQSLGGFTERRKCTIQRGLIGLYLAREIIAKQGGHIEVKSAVGKGSAFTVYLPKMIFRRKIDRQRHSRDLLFYDGSIEKQERWYV